LGGDDGGGARGGDGGVDGQRKQGCSVLKKRTKKLLDFGVRDPASVHAKEQKSFASFLQKRRVFLTFL
jgi:hypothetical protein